MSAIAFGAALLVTGYATGRARLGHRVSEWAAWQSIGSRPTGWRYVTVWTIRSAENIAWLIAHPVQGVHAWKHRNDPPPALGPAPVLDHDWAAKHQAAATQEARNEE